MCCHYKNNMLPEEKLLKTLAKHGLTLAAAESCTGGLLANRITNIPGSSKVFLLGLVTYSNKSKTKILKIPARLINKCGAVSREVAQAMAINTRKISGASLAIGITGIAGPSGLTKEKPAGTVFICVSSKNKTIAERYQFSGTRLEIKRKSTNKAITTLLELIDVVTAQYAATTKQATSTCGHLLL